MFSRFFIDRPIFASVLSIIITLAGGITLFTLPLAQYPEITPPTVEVSAYYPGANAQVVADTVAAPIEQRGNGVENMMYITPAWKILTINRAAVSFTPRGSNIGARGRRRRPPGTEHRAPRTLNGFHRGSRVVVPDGEPVWPDCGT